MVREWMEERIINTFIVSQVSPQAGRRIQLPKQAAQVKNRQLVIKVEWEKAKKKQSWAWKICQGWSLKTFKSFQDWEKDKKPIIIIFDLKRPIVLEWSKDPEGGAKQRTGEE